MDKKGADYLLIIAVWVDNHFASWKRLQPTSNLCEMGKHHRSSSK